MNDKDNQEDTVSDATNSEGHTASLQDTDRPESQSPPVQDNTDYSVHQDIEQSRAEHPSNYRPQLEDIPKLEETRKIGKKANLQMLILLIITIPLRKVTEYIVSTLHILRKLQTRDTALTTAECQA